MPMPRCSGGKVSTMIAWVLGCSPPPPAPWIMRKTTSAPRLGAMPHSRELPVNKTTHAM